MIYKIDEKPENPFKYREKVLFIDQICIRSEQQGQGFGQFIMERLEKKAKELDCHSIELDYWISNTQAQRFYQSAGFQTSRNRCVKYIK
ncbi:GNAT family N-acetyltransferase [Corticicoccus populi]|uniref:GNAT family N-acetyltransferase n=1 Tax=Corticicoccus populi TaxID=1812821 RepID=A0ABW5WWZ3_9STAP